jgi:dihydrofolate reductase
MSKVQYYTATSLDGFIADDNHSLDWLFQFQDSATDDYAEFIENVGAACMGSHTFEWLLNHMQPKDGSPQPWPYTLPVWVLTTRDLPQPFANADIRFYNGDVATVYQDMKVAANGKNIWVMGGGDLVGQFYDEGLLDELIVTIASVTLGSGKPLLPRAIVTPPLKLHKVIQYGTAFVQLRYEVTK